MFYIMFIAIKETAYVELFVVRSPDGSHYTRFLSFYEKAQKKIK